MRSSINCPVPDIRDVKLHHRPNSHILWRGDAQQCINRILSCTRNEQQEASHNAEVFVKALHAGASEALVEEASPERTAAIRSPLLVRVENVIFRRHYRMAREPAIAVASGVYVSDAGL
jgi:hypothetical protein